jgi:membrane fusion protein (multidrug efflux system)
MMKQLGLFVTVLLLIVLLAACGAGKKDDRQATAVEGNPGAPDGETGNAILVAVKKLAYERFDHYFQADGRLEAVNEAFISPEISGQIKTLHIKEGQRVKQGQLLISLNADVIESGIAEVKSQLELARTVYKKRQGLWEKKIGSEIQYLEAKTNKESLENRLKSLQAQWEMAKIKAPISGIVDQIFKKEGEMAVPGMQLLQLVNLKKIYVDAEISETYLAQIHKDDIVQVAFPSYAGLIVKAHIHRTGQVVNLKNRTFLVQLLLDNEEEKLKPNMMAVLKIKDFSAESALVVPSIIIKNDLKGTYLYVLGEDKGNVVAQKTYVETGMSEEGNTMVTQGLEPGQQVIIKGYNLVKNGTPVKLGDRG